jgi:hypothetical protein
MPAPDTVEVCVNTHGPAADQAHSLVEIHKSPVLNTQEAATLKCMLTCADRRNKLREAVVSNTVAAGNADYLAARHVLVEWMFDVSESFRFLPTTLHAAVRHVDVFMSRRRCGQATWQLCAIASLFIAVKCEESATQIPLLAQLHLMCGDAYDIDHLRRMEICVLEVLQWDPLDHGPMHFLAVFLRVMDRIVQDAASTNPSAIDAAEESCAPSAAGLKRARSEPVLGPDDVMVRDGDSRPRKMTRLSNEAASNIVREDVADEARLLSFMPDALASEDVLSPIEQSGHDDDSDLSSEDECEPPFLTAEVHELARMSNAVLDLALYDPSIGVAYHPRLLAASALYVSRCASSLNPVWPTFLASVTGTTEDEMRRCSSVLSHVFTSAQSSDVTSIGGSPLDNDSSFER